MRAENILEIRDRKISATHWIQHRDIFVWEIADKKLSRLVGDTAIWSPSAKVEDNKTDKYLASYYFDLKIITAKQYKMALAWGKSTKWQHTIPWEALSRLSIIYAWEDGPQRNILWGMKRKDANEMRDLYHATHKDMIIKDFFV